MRFREYITATIVVLLSSATAAQGQWRVDVVPFKNPLAIGGCGQVTVRAFDPKLKGTARTAGGNSVSNAGYFDMSVETSNKNGVSGRFESSSIWTVCACRAATVGSQAKITATYPAKALPEKLRAGGITAVGEATFTIVAGDSRPYNPPGCMATTVVATARPSPPPPAVATPLTRAVPSGPVIMPVAPIVASPGANPPAPTGQALIPPAINTATGTTIAGPVLSATARMTKFTVANGFQFVNDYQNNIFGPPLNVESNGLCGGMTYSVLDYFLSGKQVPNQDYRPANATQLQSYFYGRQFTSLALNLDRWIELWDPAGLRSLEFFNWGLSGQLNALRSFIDRGVPVPLGLSRSGSGALNHDHQVLAIGYDLGRYKSDLGNYKEDVKIYIIDPNHPGVMMTLVPDPLNRWYFYTTETGSRWRSYFVDSKYAAVIPPDAPNVTYPNDGLIHELLARFETGDDDMRGGADHVDLKVILTNNTTQNYQNISLGGRWLPYVTEIARVVLTTPLNPAAIKSLVISTNATPGINGDNWDMKNLRVYVVGGLGSRVQSLNRWGPYRFLNPGIPYTVDFVY